MTPGLISYNVNHTTHCVLATIVIGEKYLSNWETFSRASWLRFAKQFNIGIIALTQDLLDIRSHDYKNPAWQKLLLPQLIKEHWPNVDSVCLMDSDILISPMAQNIFEMLGKDQIAVVSQESRLPYDLTEVKRRIAFYRNRFYSEKYPLDSILFASPEQIFNLLGLPPQKDYFCSGIILVDIALAEFFSKSFYDISNQQFAKSNDLAWEEPFINYLVQSSGKVKWLDYGFQTLWTYEMAWKYPFLYELGPDISRSDLTRKCVENTLLSCSFLHFAGTWYESKAWEFSQLSQEKGFSRLLYEYVDYLDQPVTGLPLGKILPT